MQVQNARPILRPRSTADCRLAGTFPNQFLPDFLEPLPFAVVVAKDVDGVILPQPAVELLEKFAPLRLGNLRFRRALGQRTEGVQAAELRLRH